MKFKVLVLASILAISLNASNSVKDGFHFNLGLGINSVDGKKISPYANGDGLVKDLGFASKFGLGYDKIFQNNLLIGFDGFFSLNGFMFDQGVVQEYHNYYLQGEGFYWFYGYELATKIGYKIDKFIPYLKRAYQKVSISGPSKNPISDYSFSGFGWGMGFDYYFARTLSFGFDYTMYSVKGHMKGATSESTLNKTFSINFTSHF